MNIIDERLCRTSLGQPNSTRIDWPPSPRTVTEVRRADLGPHKTRESPSLRPAQNRHDGLIHRLRLLLHDLMRGLWDNDEVQGVAAYDRTQWFCVCLDLCDGICLAINQQHGHSAANHHVVCRQLPLPIVRLAHVHRIGTRHLFRLLDEGAMVVGTRVAGLCMQCSLSKSRAEGWPKPIEDKYWEAEDSNRRRDRDERCNQDNCRGCPGCRKRAHAGWVSRA
mmetsp:Transcript_2694/g.7415  ORF Transcript_2694/g.7415 Transcript_2694/m.7415 type:complete len:222 (-) Transcript_2694:399-1064(-)